MKTIILLIALLSCLPGLLAEPVRVALIPMDATAQNMADLALAELSGDAGITFLERAEIDKIQKELQLTTLADFIPDPQLMQNTQVFAVMLKHDFIAFDARTGVRLVDLPNISAEAVGGALRDAIAKRNSLTTGKLRKLSCMPLVPANLSKDQEDLARRLEATLLRTLGNQKDVVVLERRHLILLLNEPGTEHQDLTKDLFAGALVFKLTATPEGKDNIRLKVHVFSPNGKTLLSEETGVFQAKADLDEQCRQFLSTMPMPADRPEDKSGEARNFIYEAWFLMSHSLDGDAIASAASASVLDAKQEKELCYIAAKAGCHLLPQRKKPPAEHYAVAMANLKLAARLAKKHQVFPYELNLAMWNTMTLTNQKEFAQLPANLQREMQETIEAILEIRLDTLAECRRQAELPGEKWSDCLFALEARFEYIRELNDIARTEWDYSYWDYMDRCIYPELVKYVAEIDKALPELQKYENLPIGEKSKIKELAQSQKRRVRRYYGYPLTFYPNEKGKPFFFLSRPNKRDEVKMAIYRKTMELLASSKLLPLAYHGRLQLLYLQTIVPSLQHLNSVKGRIHPRDRSALLEFYQDLVKIFETAESVGSPQESIGFLTDVFSDSSALEYRLPIQESAMRRFAWYTPWRNDLIKGSAQWSTEERQALHRRLDKYIEECTNDPRLDLKYGSIRQETSQYFQRLQKQLESQNQGLPPTEPKTAMATVNPFERVITPLKDSENDIRTIVFGEEDGIIYLGEYLSGSIRIVRVDTKANLAISKGPKHALPEHKAGCTSTGVILADYLAFHHGGYVSLVPKKNDETPESIKFRQYCKFRCNAIVGCGDRLFLSFDGKPPYPGTVLEYNVATKETRLLVSTLDRSVKWPLQGTQYTYAINNLLCDPTQQRLIMLMHDKPAPPPDFGRYYTIRFQAYCWETKTWQALSRRLPIGCTEKRYSFNDYNLFYLENGELWLLFQNGFGKINAEGNWQPVFVMSDFGRFSDKWSLFLGTKFEPIIVDHSQCGAFTQKYKDLDVPNFHHYDQGILFAKNMFIFVPEKTILPIAPSFQVSHLTESGHAIGGEGKNLQIGVLKDRKELLKMGK